MTVAERAGRTWPDLYAAAVARLGSAREARWMVEEASGHPWSALLSPDPAATAPPVPDRARRRLASMLDRRIAGEPLQYVLGSWSFRRLELMVDRRVLIPRPETEVVVDAALAELDRIAATGSRPCVVDLGTGSGAIALAIADERPGTEVWATDLSGDALDVARANLAGIGGRGAPHVRLVAGDWYAALPDDRRGRVDVVVSNPPYIATAELAGLEPVVAGWEPRPALEAGPTGLEAVHAVLSQAPEWLTPGRGAVVVEIGEGQGGAARRLAAEAGLADAEVRPDLAGRDRILVARTAPPASAAAAPATRTGPIGRTPP